MPGDPCAPWYLDWTLSGDSGRQLRVSCIFLFLSPPLVGRRTPVFCKKLGNHADGSFSCLFRILFVSLSYKWSQLQPTNLLKFCLSIVLSVSRNSFFVSKVLTEPHFIGALFCSADRLSPAVSFPPPERPASSTRRNGLTCTHFPL